MLNLSPFLLLQQWTSFSPTVFPSLLDCFHKAQIFCNFCCLKIFLWPHVPLKPQPPFLFLWNSFCICSFNACPPFLLGTHYYQMFPPFLDCNFSCHCPQWSPRSKTQWSVLDPYFTRPTCRIWPNHSRLHETVSLCASQVLQSPGFSPGFSIFFLIDILSLLYLLITGTPQDLTLFSSLFLGDLTQSHGLNTKHMLILCNFYLWAKTFSLTHLNIQQCIKANAGSFHRHLKLVQK